MCRWGSEVCLHFAQEALEIELYSMRSQLDSESIKYTQLEWKFNALREHCESLQEYTAELHEGKG